MKGDDECLVDKYWFIPKLVGDAILTPSRIHNRVPHRKHNIFHMRNEKEENLTLNT